MNVYLLVTFHESVTKEAAALRLIRQQLELIGADVEPVTATGTKTALAFTLPEKRDSMSAIIDAIHPNKAEAPCHYIVTPITWQTRTTLPVARWIGQRLNLPPGFHEGSNT